jgi:uncharacterized membrane protein HdeD (DUF308 family)
MEATMTEQAKATLQKSIPWRRGLAWWIVGLEGLLLLAAGIYVVAAPDNAKDAVRVIIGAFLLANSVSFILAGLRPEALSNPITPYRMLAAGSGLTVGIIVILQPWSENISDDAARVILALGLLAHGAFSLVGAFAARATGELRRGVLLTGALSVLFAVLLFYNVRHETLDMRWFGYVALAAGVLVCGYAFALYKARQVTPEVASAAPTPGAAASEPALAPAETAQPPVPPSPEPAATELKLLDVPSNPITSPSTDR